MIHNINQINTKIKLIFLQYNNKLYQTINQIPSKNNNPHPLQYTINPHIPFGYNHQFTHLYQIKQTTNHQLQPNQIQMHHKFHQKTFILYTFQKPKFLHELHKLTNHTHIHQNIFIHFNHNNNLQYPSNPLLTNQMLTLTRHPQHHNKFKTNQFLFQLHLLPSAHNLYHINPLFLNQQINKPTIPIFNQILII